MSELWAKIEPDGSIHRVWMFEPWAQDQQEQLGKLEKFVPEDELTRLRTENEELRRDKERLGPVIKIIEELRQITPNPPDAITWERGVAIINKVQDELCPAIDKAPSIRRRHPKIEGNMTKTNR